MWANCQSLQPERGSNVTSESVQGIGRRQETLVMLQAHANQPHRQVPLFKEGKNTERVMRGSTAHLRLVLFQGELLSATVIEK